MGSLNPFDQLHPFLLPQHGPVSRLAFTSMKEPFGNLSLESGHLLPFLDGGLKVLHYGHFEVESGPEFLLNFLKLE